MLVVALLVVAFALVKLGCGCPYHSAIKAACACSLSDLPEVMQKVCGRARNQLLGCFCLVSFLQETLVSSSYFCT